MGAAINHPPNTSAPRTTVTGDDHARPHWQLRVTHERLGQRAKQNRHDDAGENDEQVLTERYPSHSATTPPHARATAMLVRFAKPAGEVRFAPRLISSPVFSHP